MHVEELLTELTRLRTGPGLQARRLRPKAGPALQQVCDVGPDDVDAQIRSKIVSRITAACRHLTPADARAVHVALNFDPDCRFRFFQDRMDCLGHLIHRERRTAVRRVDDAFQLLAELLDATPPAQRPASRFAPGGWYFDVLHSTLVLEDGRLSLTELRRITATTDGLESLSVAWSTERSEQYDGGFTVELLSGGELVCAPERTGDGVWAGDVRLPQALVAGQSHEYCTRVTQVGHVEPYYIVTPFRRTDLFELRVMFASDSRPDCAWRVAGEPARFVDDPAPDREPLDVNAAGELATSFEQLDIGLSYGIRWSTT